MAEARHEAPAPREYDTSSASLCGPPGQPYPVIDPQLSAAASLRITAMNRDVTPLRQSDRALRLIHRSPSLNHPKEAANGGIIQPRCLTQPTNVTSTEGSAGSEATERGAIIHGHSGLFIPHTNQNSSFTLAASQVELVGCRMWGLIINMRAFEPGPSLWRRGKVRPTCPRCGADKP